MLNKFPKLKTTMLIIAIGVALVSVSIVRNTILKGATVVTLAPAQQLAGVVAQSMTGNSKGSLPALDVDFHLTGVHFFGNSSWAVAYVSPTHGTFDPGYVVLQKYQGLYRVVLGPGSSFDSSYEQTLPVDVMNYLQSQGVVHDSTNG